MAVHDSMKGCIQPEVYILLVNYNNSDDTIVCLDSLLNVSYPNFVIIVVDNASTGNSVENISSWLRARGVEYSFHQNGESFSAVSRVVIMRSESNVGFAGANNLGITFALKNSADFVLLLNNDTTVTSSFLDSMVKMVQERPDVGIVGGTVKYFRNKSAIWFAGGKIDLIRGAFYHRSEACRGIIESDFITGCLMLIPCPVFEKVGLFDERYFLNVEDIDFSYRVSRAGYKLLVDCASEVYHKVSSSIGGLYSARNQYYFHRNRMFFFSRRLSSFRKLLFLIFQFSIAIPVWMGFQLIKGNMQAVKGAFFGYLDFARNCYGKSRYF